MSNIKEADQRLIIHNKWCAGKNQQNFLFVSNDTDVLVHLIHYYQMFHDLGAAKLWIRVGPKKPAAHFSAHTNCHYKYTRFPFERFFWQHTQALAVVMPSQKNFFEDLESGP